ncbi:MAG: HD domain-containing protein [Planctomycetia bacterium]|nr:HD domain-containing protein [Planctomycetia bacterium]
MSGAASLDDFQARVDDFVTKSLFGYRAERHAKEKSIRDAIWGTCLFYPWEVAILDSPLLQRLRDVRQTGLAYLIYPTAMHTRFDHTLGVVTVASRIVRSINEKHASSKQNDPRINHADHMRVRLSALLHDVGHSCLSHVSETVYGSSNEFRLLIRQINSDFGVTPKPHEVMSWLIARSTPFKEFIAHLQEKEIVPHAEPALFAPDDLEDIANNIIGYRKDPRKKFLADIINGPMDADKLDYLVRDAYFAGPTVVYDLDRFLHTVDAIEYPRDESLPDGGRKVVRLSVPIHGVTALEQIIISKLMLFSYLYHHHKIRCVEGMYHEVLKRLIEVSKQPKKKGTKRTKRTYPTMGHPTDFLSLSDRSVLPHAWPPEVEGDPVADTLISMLMRRDLYKRALVISRLFIRDIDTNAKAKSGFERLLSCGTDSAGRDELRKLIYDDTIALMKSKPYKERTKEFRSQFMLQHILLDIPRSPTVEETEAVMVPTSSQSQGHDPEFVPLSDMFPIEKWVDAYNAIKWRGHVFTIEEAVPFVNEVVIDILGAPPYNLAFSPQATELCKIGHSTLLASRLFRG